VRRRSRHRLLERAEIYDFVRQHGITGFATVAGDRHSSGQASREGASASAFDPVGIVFVTGSISAPGLVEALDTSSHRRHPLRPLYLADPPARNGAGPHKPKPAVNMLLKHGVKSCLEYARSADIAQARTLSNAQLAPHLSSLTWAATATPPSAQPTNLRNRICLHSTAD